MERYDRERRKEEEKLLRERQREEEKSLREQKRELECREKFLQREKLKAERMRQKEELRIEREAVKRKAAVEKAAARKIAKESLDIIEDEQLELMELAAASMGLSSIVHLIYDTLQNLDSFRDDLCIFPPVSVHLKKPFLVQPWMDSEKHIGNLLMVSTMFESAMKRDYLSSNFEMTKELLGSFPSSVPPAVGSLPALPWLPKTTAALALRLFELDSSLVYMEHEKAEASADKSAKVYMKIPSRYSPQKNEDVEQKELKQGRHIKEDNYGEVRSKRKNNKGGRGGGDKGPPTKLQRKVPRIKSDTGRSRGIENLNEGPRQQGRRTDVQGRARGQRRVRKRRADTVPEEPLLGRLTARVGSMSYLSKRTVEPKSCGASFSNLVEDEEEEWGGVGKEAEMGVEGEDNSSNSAGAAESEDNVEEEGYEQGFRGASNGR